MIFAGGVLGYFLFYGRVAEISISASSRSASRLSSIISLTSMSGTQYKIDSSVPIGGHNGILRRAADQSPWDILDLQLGYESSSAVSTFPDRAGIDLCRPAFIAGEARIRTRRDPQFAITNCAPSSSKLRCSALQAHHLRYRRWYCGHCRYLICQLGIIHRPERIQYSVLRPNHYLDHGWRARHSARRRGRCLRDSVAQHLSWHQQNRRPQHCARYNLYRVCAAGASRSISRNCLMALFVGLRVPWCGSRWRSSSNGSRGKI